MNFKIKEEAFLVLVIHSLLLIAMFGVGMLVGETITKNKYKEELHKLFSQSIPCNATIRISPRESAVWKMQCDIDYQKIVVD
jgi:hypothetical protein